MQGLAGALVRLGQTVGTGPKVDTRKLLPAGDTVAIALSRIARKDRAYDVKFKILEALRMGGRVSKDGVKTQQGQRLGDLILHYFDVQPKEYDSFGALPPLLVCEITFYVYFQKVRKLTLL